MLIVHQLIFFLNFTRHKESKQAETVALDCLDLAQEPQIAIPVVTSAIADMCLTLSSQLLVPAGADASASNVPALVLVIAYPVI